MHLITVWPWPFDLGINARHVTAMHCTFTKFGVDSSNKRPFYNHYTCLCNHLQLRTEKSFTAYVPLPMATTAFGLGRKQWNSPQWGYLWYLKTFTDSIKKFRNKKPLAELTPCDVMAIVWWSWGTRTTPFGAGSRLPSTLSDLESVTEMDRPFTFITRVSRTNTTWFFHKDHRIKCFCTDITSSI